MDCNAKYNFLQQYCGFRDDPIVQEGGRIPDNASSIRISVDGKATGLTVPTNTPNSKVAFKINGHIHSESTADMEGLARFDSEVNFDRIHCAQLVSDGNIVDFSVTR